MATASQIASYESEILAAASAGTPTNPRGLPYPLATLLIAQAKHESGNFTSNGFIEGRNAYGYAFVPGARWQLSTPGRIADNKQPLAMYKTLGDSVREVVDWIYRRVNEGKFPANLSSITTPEQYARYLKDAGYYGDTYANYSGGLARWFQNLSGSSKAAVGVGGVILLGILGAVAWFAVKRSRKEKKRIGKNRHRNRRRKK